MKFFRILFLFLFMLPLFSKQQTRQTKKKDPKASFYHDSLHGLITSSGESYDKNDFTAAHRSLPFNTLVLVTNKKNGKSVIVRINDRGPFVKSRVIDLSHSAAKKLGMISYGVVPVRISELNFLQSFPLNDVQVKEHAFWDCYGSKKNPEKKTVYVWRTDDWKHAFYMASSLSFDYDIDSLIIYISENETKREFHLLITSIETEAKAKELMRQLKADGFSHSAIFTTD